MTRGPIGADQYNRLGYDAFVERRSPALSRAIIVVAILAALWPLVRSEFGGFDDAMNITHNPRLNPPTWSGVLHYWRQPEFDLYIPVTYTVWSAVAKLAYLPRADAMGVWLNPYLFHLTNLLLHVLSGLLVFEILRRCIGSVPAATLGAGVFALHPLQVEPVGWVAGMKDVLAGMFALVALWQYIGFVQSDRKSVRRWRWTIGTVAFVLAMLSKPGVVVVPFIAWLIDVLLLGRDVRGATRRAAPWLVLAIPCIIWTRLIQPAPFIAEAIPIYLRPLVGADTISFYLGKLFVPVRLGVDYGRTPHRVLDSSWIWLGWIGPVALLIIAGLARRRAPALTAAIAIFLVALTPVLGIVPFDFQAYSTVADHYMYLPMLGAAFAVAWVATLRPHRVTRIVLGSLVVVLGIISVRQTWHWRDAQAIYTHALSVNPRSWASYAQLSTWHSARGDFTRALESAQRAADINPRAFTVHNLVAANLAKLGRTNDAIDAYRRALSIHPNDVLANINLANLLANQKQFDDAIRHYEAALNVDPNSVAAHTNLGGVFEETGRMEMAIEWYRRALQIDPTSAEALAGLARCMHAPPSSTAPAAR